MVLRPLFSLLITVISCCEASTDDHDSLVAVPRRVLNSALGTPIWQSKTPQINLTPSCFGPDCLQIMRGIEAHDSRALGSVKHPRYFLSILLPGTKALKGTVLAESLIIQGVTKG